MTGYPRHHNLRLLQQIASRVPLGQRALQGARSLAVKLACWLWCAFGVVAFASDDLDPAPGAQGYHWNFERENDVDFDEWPDQWKRYLGIGYPKYVNIKIVPRDEALESQFKAIDTSVVQMWPSMRKTIPSLPTLPDLFGNRYLRVKLDGGQARVQSNPLSTSPLYQYRFSIDISTRALVHDSVTASLVFVDANNKEVAIETTPSISGTTEWKQWVVDRVQAPANAAKMFVRLSVTSPPDGLQDIRGEVGFDNISIEPFPQIRLETDRAFGVYERDTPVTVKAKLIGLGNSNAQVRFRLLNHDGDVVAIQTVSASKSDRASGPSDVVTWNLPSLPPGFYRVTGSLAEQRNARLETDTSFVIVQSLGEPGARGPYGWMLPRTDGRDARQIAEWLTQLGVSWLKYPVWRAPNDVAGITGDAALLDKLQQVDIQTVGVLDAPPPSELDDYERSRDPNSGVSMLLSDAKIWQPKLDPITSQLTLKVRWWQLGGDEDHSFMGRTRMEHSIAQIRKGIQGFGQSVNVAVSWPLLDHIPTMVMPTWQGVNFSSEIPLTAEELEAFLTDRHDSTGGLGPTTWIVLDPIDKSRYDSATRIRDLVLRMVAIRGHKVQAATISDPYDPKHGLLREDGRPDEMLLPWRTTSMLIGNLQPVGSLDLRSGAENRVFAGQRRSVVMLWAPQPTVEEIYFGEQVQSVDVWGRVRDLPVIDQQGSKVQRVEIGPTPIFIIGADPSLLAFRMSVALANPQLGSYIGRTQKLSLVYTNPTRDGMTGELRILHPGSWSVDAPNRSWELLAGKSATQEFDVVLSNSARIGTYQVAFQFDFQSTPPRQITVYRDVEVGVPGLEVKLLTRLMPNNELRVVVEFINRTANMQAYDCMLFPPPGRQYQRRFLEVGAGETVSREFYWDNGRELLGGRVLLRAVEKDGQRILNVDTEVTP